jgi:hypothetical protein
MIAAVIKNHPDRPLPNLRRKPVRCLLRHSPILSTVGASGNPGAVQHARRIAMGQRNACLRRTAQGGCHAWNHVEGNARFDQGLGFLTASAENKWIATLQPHHAQPLAREFDQQRVDPLLQHAMQCALLADENAPCITVREVQHLATHQPVMHDDIRLSERAERAT